MKDTIRAALDALLSRSQQPYDGVLGTLPQWIPANFHAEFESTRNTLIQDGYSPEDIQRFMVEIVEFEQAALANPDECPAFNFAAPFKIMGAVYKLARFQEAVRIGQGQGEEKGLIYLTDTRTAGLVTTGKKFQTHRPIGSVSAKREHIYKLAADNPMKTAKELMQIADKIIIGKMSPGTFANHVSGARKLKP